jgi:TetR/AcrR family transcriptional regulator, fatty acid metabolism regulator protein
MQLQKPPTKRQQRSMRTKQRIYEKSIELINAYGYENVTIADICKHSHIPVGTFYHYYPSKDDILLYCSESEDQMMMSKMKSLPEGSHSSRYKYLVRARLRMATARSPELSGYFRIAHIRNKVFDSYSSERWFHQGLLEEVVAGQEDGEFVRDIDSVVIVEMALFLIDGLTSAWMLSNGSLDIEKKADEQVDLILRLITEKI